MSKSPAAISRSIVSMRGQRVILDSDLARLYGVTTKALNQAVKRNRNRFPAEFVFRLTDTERDEVVTICDHLRKLKFSPNLPYAFTEHGALMASSVLSTERAAEVSVFIVRAFIHLREGLFARDQLGKRIDDIEVRLAQKFGKYDHAIAELLAAMRRLMSQPGPERKHRIGFIRED